MFINALHESTVQRWLRTTNFLRNFLRQLKLGPSSNVFFFELVLISWMVTLSSCLIWQIISFLLPRTNKVVYTLEPTLGSGPAIDLHKISILTKKSSFQIKFILILRECKQAKLSHLGYSNPSRILTHTFKSRRT